MKIDVFKDTIIAGADISPNRFVLATGLAGASVNPAGVTSLGGEEGDPIDLMIIGVADVDIADGETPVAGDLVASDADGKAVVNNTTGKILVKSVSTNTIEVWLK